MMRAAQVIASLHPDGGGLTKTAAALAAALASRGTESALIFPCRSGEMEIITRSYGHFPGFEKVQCYPLPVGPVAFLKGSGLKGALNEFQPTIVHTHGLWEPLLAHAQREAMRRGIPYVVFPQSMLHPWQSRHHRLAKWVLKKPLGWQRRWRQAAFVQVLSEAEAGHWREQGGCTIRQIANGIFPEEGDWTEEVELPEWSLKPYLLSLARLHPQKSPDLLLEAFSRLAVSEKDLQLVLAGPDYGLKNNLLAQVNELGLQGRVHFPGAVQGAEKWALLRGCACFCLPSQAEGFSLALLEAGLAGVPAVISEGCYFVELVQAGGALQAPLDAGAWADALAGVLAAPEGMGARARELVCGKYSWQAIAGEMEQAYREAGA